MTVWVRSISQIRFAGRITSEVKKIRALPCGGFLSSGVLRGMSVIRMSLRNKNRTEELSRNLSLERTSLHNKNLAEKEFYLYAECLIRMSLHKTNRARKMFHVLKKHEFT